MITLLYFNMKIEYEAILLTNKNSTNGKIF